MSYRKRLITITAFIAGACLESAAFAQSNCPPPSVAQGGQCVLNRDATLTDTMWIPSGTKLNCQGHRLTPVATGVLDDPRTPANEFKPSRPELAIFVNTAYDVTIQNCAISGFDFGIIVAVSKAAGAPPSTQNKIFDNTIDVRTNSIYIMKSDQVLISGNQLTYASERGRGLVIAFDSDYNQVTGNTITGTDAASTGLVRELPGGAFVTTNTAIMDNPIHVLQSDTMLANLVVSGILIQVPSGERGTDLEDTSRSDHNLIEANQIVGLGVGRSCTLDPATFCQADTDCPGKGACLLKQNSGIGFNLRASDTVVSNNTISGRMQRGISFGGAGAVLTLQGWFPGACTLNPNRKCATDSDCNIAGYDTTGYGTCQNAESLTFDANTLRLTATGNVLSGQYAEAAPFANNTETFLYNGNTVNGGVSGVRINALAVNGTVERNIVSGAGNALYLMAPASWSHVIRLNDFTNYSAAIRTKNFTTPTDISTDKGNYWGLACPGFDPSRVLFDNGLIDPYVYDGKPYGVPVAGTPEAS